MRVNRRSVLTGVFGGGIAGRAIMPGGREPSRATASALALKDLDSAAAAPVLKLDGLKSPVIIESIKLLKMDKEHFVHMRAKDGVEGISLTNPPRAECLDRILQQLVAPFFVGKDARDLERLLRELYRWNSNYKMYGLALWCPQARVEFAILDMLGRIANKPIGALLLAIVDENRDRMTRHQFLLQYARVTGCVGFTVSQNGNSGELSPGMRPRNALFTTEMGNGLPCEY